jgi:hypothetical protein
MSHQRKRHAAEIFMPGTFSLFPRRKMLKQKTSQINIYVLEVTTTRYPLHTECASAYQQDPCLNLLLPLYHVIFIYICTGVAALKLQTVPLKTAQNYYFPQGCEQQMFGHPCLIPGLFHFRLKQDESSETRQG